MSKNKYLNSGIKRVLDISFSIPIFLATLPLMLGISVAIYLTSGRPIYFLQKRVGKNGVVFHIFKFRTMINGAEKMQKKYKQLNESDGPAFKIKDDPRFTKFGKWLSRSGLDELPQFINVIRGEMSVVGPRPLPVNEAAKLAPKYYRRHLISPGITSTWVVNGSHSLKFSEWMKLDLAYLKKASLLNDLKIIFWTVMVVLK